MSLIQRYFLLINLITALFFAIDKRKAVNNKWRIPELSLFILALLGGSLGGILAMRIFRHKTNSIKFALIMPVLLIINALVYYYSVY